MNKTPLDDLIEVIKSPELYPEEPIVIYPSWMMRLAQEQADIEGITRDEWISKAVGYKIHAVENPPMYETENE